MKYVIRLFILLVAGILPALLIIPVSHTNWANNIRVEINEWRAKRRNAMQEQNSKKEMTSDKPVSSDIKIDNQSSKEKSNEAVVHKSEHSSSSTPSSTSPEHQSPQKNQGPKMRSPDFSLQSLSEIIQFLVFTGIPFCIVIGLKRFLSPRNKSVSKT